MSRSVYTAQKRSIEKQGRKAPETRVVNEPYGEYQSSLAYAEIASKHAHSEASFNLGLRYINGDGVGKDEAKGVTYLTLAHHQGHPHAAEQLHKYYHGTSTTLGIVTDKDLDKKAKFWGQAAGKLSSNTKN